MPYGEYSAGIQKSKRFNIIIFQSYCATGCKPILNQFRNSLSLARHSEQTHLCGSEESHCATGYKPK